MPKPRRVKRLDADLRRHVQDGLEHMKQTAKTLTQMATDQKMDPTVLTDELTSLPRHWKEAEWKYAMEQLATSNLTDAEIGNCLRYIYHTSTQLAQQFQLAV